MNSLTNKAFCFKSIFSEISLKVCSRGFHSSLGLTKESSKSSSDDGSSRGEKKQVEVTEELRDAAGAAARTLPGNWESMAETLLARLSDHSSSQPKPSNKPDASGKESKSLLESMRVYSAPAQRDQDRRMNNQRGQRTTAEQKKSERQEGQKPVQGARRQATPKVIYSDIYEVPRLGIFNAEKVAAAVSAGGQGPLGQGLWEAREAERAAAAMGSVPRNAWEEQIEWTKQGKLWTFPIDNEADAGAEATVAFHQHVFLERHLEGRFPDKGPVKAFMRLVCQGLSQSPWLTVNEKVAHIHWYSDYFKEKQPLLEASERESEIRPDQGL